MLVVAIGVLGATISIATSLTLSDSNGEEIYALDAARQEVALIQDYYAQLNIAFGAVFAHYSAAPYNTFTVNGLQNATGAISFPTDATGTQLLESGYTDTNWNRHGLPRDLSGNGSIDTADHFGELYVVAYKNLHHLDFFHKRQTANREFLHVSDPVHNPGMIYGQQRF